MKTTRHILGIIGRSLLILIAVLFIVLSIAGIAGTWYVNRVATDVTLNIFSVVDSGVSIGISGVDQALTRVKESRAEMAQTAEDIDTLGENLKENHPALTAISERIDERLAPTVEKIQTTLAPVRDGLIKVDAILTIANGIPYVQENAPDLQKLQDAIKTVMDLGADIKELRTTIRASLEEQSDQMTEQTTQLLLNIINRVDERLAQTQSNLEDLQEQINELSQRIAALKSEILFALNLVAVIATLLYLWVIYSQIVVIGAQVRKLRGEPRCPECPEVESTDLPAQPAPVAAVTAPPPDILTAPEPEPAPGPLPETDSAEDQSSLSD